MKRLSSSGTSCQVKYKFAVSLTAFVLILIKYYAVTVRLNLMILCIWSAKIIKFRHKSIFFINFFDKFALKSLELPSYVFSYTMLRRTLARRSTIYLWEKSKLSDFNNYVLVFLYYRVKTAKVLLYEVTFSNAFHKTPPLFWYKSTIMRTLKRVRNWKATKQTFETLPLSLV